MIFTKFGTVVDLACIMTYAKFGWNRLKGGHFAAVQNLPFSHDFNGWPYNRQALTCCRDIMQYATVHAILHALAGEGRLIRCYNVNKPN